MFGATVPPLHGAPPPPPGSLRSDPTQNNKAQNTIWLSPSCAAPDGPSADLVWDAFRKGFLCAGKAAAQPRGQGPLDEPEPPPLWAGEDLPLGGARSGRRSRNTCVKPGGGSQY